MSNQNAKSEGVKHNEYTRPAQVWRSGDKILTLQDGPIQVYTERNLTDGSVKTEFFIKTGKP